MRFWNDGKGEVNILQNQFTRYLVIAIERRKADIQKKKDRLNYYEQVNEDLDRNADTATGKDILDSPGFSMVFENPALEHALQKLGKRDRYILFMRVLEERDFEELADEVGLKYKGVAAVYYRTIRKIRKEMGVDE